MKNLNAQNDRLTHWRLWVFLIGMILTLGAMAVNNWLSLLVFIVSLSGFIRLVVIHNRVRDHIRRFEIWQRIKATHLARICLDWQGLPPETATSEPQHPFALDLNLVGVHGLHRLLDTSVSKGGSERLRDWLLAQSPDSAVIEKRQALLRELIPLAMFRQGDQKWSVGTRWY